MKILFFGESATSLKFMKEALRKQGAEFTYFPLRKINAVSFRDSDFQLTIVDLTSTSPEIFNQLYVLRHDLLKPHVPILALLPRENSRLRYRLVEIGVDDFLLSPFDKLDVETRVKVLLRNTSFKQQNKKRFGNDIDRMPPGFLCAKFLQLLSKPLHSFNPDEIVRDSIQFLHRTISPRQILFFKVVNDREIVLKHAFPKLVEEVSVKIGIDELPVITKSVRLRETSVVNQVTEQNLIHTYLKSILNLNVTAFAALPMVVNNQTEALLLMLRTDNGKFNENHFQQILQVVKFIEASLQLSHVQSELQEKFDSNVWKYSYDFLQLIIRQLNFGILVLDRENKVKYLNEPAARIFHVDPEKVLYQPAEKILGKQNAKTIFSLPDFSEGTYERPEIEIAGEDGEKILIGFNRMKFYDDISREEGFIITLKDITYSKEMQEEMRRIDRLASLGVMASGIAHEIRNPLAGIKAIAQTFEEELQPDDPKNEFVSRIIRQVNRLDEMLRTLFSYAKPQKPNRQFCQIEEIVQEVLPLLKQNLQNQSIKLTQSYASNLPALYIDHSQIQQVLFNLFLNSVEAIQNKGEIRISIEPVTEGMKRFLRKPFFRKITENPFVLIHIADNGSGIPRDHLNQIFNPFFTTKNFGTGLGLSIVYQIVKENDGVIYFESDLKKGTDCFLFLPSFAPGSETATGKNL